jgi:hypothetical protein
MSNNDATIQVKVPSELRESFKSKAEECDRQVSQLIRGFMRDYVSGVSGAPFNIEEKAVPFKKTQSAAPVVRQVPLPSKNTNKLTLKEVVRCDLLGMLGDKTPAEEVEFYALMERDADIGHEPFTDDAIAAERKRQKR